MLVDSVAMVRGLYEAFNRGDLPTAWFLLDPAISFVEPLVSRLPYAGLHIGPRSVVAAVFRYETAVREDLRAFPETFLYTGESVVVLGFFRSVNRETGELLRAPFVHECFVHGGKIVRIHSYPETARATKLPD